MELIRRLDCVPAHDCVVTIGSFDGLHRGHQALIDRLLTHAAQRSLAPVMLSFEPLPREFMQPLQPPARLTNFRERWRLLSDSGIERLWLLPFDDQVRSLSAMQFMQLLRQVRARVVVVGHDFHFGRGGEADVEWCRASAAEFGFTLDVVPAVLLEGERVSSGLVRSALAAGDLARAQRLLGRCYSMRGRVRGGNRLGRTLGFPTANLAVKRRRVPLGGVFAVRIVGDGLDGWPGVANLGTRPMVNGQDTLLEVNLFDFAGDLYGRELEVQFFRRLREERSFATMDDMVVQMHRDAQQAREILSAPAHTGD